MPKDNSKTTKKSKKPTEKMPRDYPYPPVPDGYDQGPEYYEQESTQLNIRQPWYQMAQIEDEWDREYHEQLKKDPNYYVTPDMERFPWGSSSHHQPKIHPRQKDIYTPKTMAVFENTIARAMNEWSMTQSKIFLCALSKIRYRDNLGNVKLSRNELVKVLGFEDLSTNRLKKEIINLAGDSFFHFENKSGWDNGFIIAGSSCDRYNIYIQFNLKYLPLLEKLRERFTTVRIYTIAQFKRKYSYSFYVWLKSWVSPNHLTETQWFLVEDIPQVFDLEPGKYRKGKNTDRFSFSAFEKNVLYPAMEEINTNPQSDIFIEHIQKEYWEDGRVSGYRVDYVLRDPEVIDLIE